VTRTLARFLVPASGVRTGDELGCELGDELGVQVGGGPGGQVGGPSVPVGAQGVGLSACWGGRRHGSQVSGVLVRATGGAVQMVRDNAALPLA